MARRGVLPGPSSTGSLALKSCPSYSAAAIQAHALLRSVLTHRAPPLPVFPPASPAPGVSAPLQHLMCGDKGDMPQRQCVFMIIQGVKKWDLHDTHSSLDKTDMRGMEPAFPDC